MCLGSEYKSGLGTRLTLNRIGYVTPSNAYRVRVSLRVRVRLRVSICLPHRNAYSTILRSKDSRVSETTGHYTTYEGHYKGGVLIQ